MCSYLPLIITTLDPVNLTVDTSDTTHFLILCIFAVIFPFLGPYISDMKMFDMLPRDSVEFFADIVRRTIEMRKDSDVTNRVCTREGGGTQIEYSKQP